MVTAVAPKAGVVTAIVTGGTAVTVAQPPMNGIYITNPASAGDQGIATAENLYVDPVTTAVLFGRGTAVSLAPGQSWSGVPGSVSPVSVNAATAGHRFTVVVW